MRHNGLNGVVFVCVHADKEVVCSYFGIDLKLQIYNSSL